MSILKRLWSAFEFGKTDPTNTQFLLAMLSFAAGLRWLGWVWLVFACLRYIVNVFAPD